MTSGDECDALRGGRARVRSEGRSGLHCKLIVQSGGDRVEPGTVACDREAVRTRTISCCTFWISVAFNRSERSPFHSRAAGLIVAFGFSVATLFSQSPSFEVASVLPLGRIEPRDSRLRPLSARPSGQVDAAVSLRDLIIWAFAVDPDLVKGSFSILDDAFAVTAKASGPVPLAPSGEVGPMNLMMQSLLAERFRLTVRREVRNRRTYALRRVSSDRLGPNLKPLAVECPSGLAENVNAAPAGCRTKFTLGLVTGVVRMPDLAAILSPLMGMPVVDETGLTGAFEIKTAFSPQSSDNPFPPYRVLGGGWERLPSIARALRNDLGLKLESARHDFSALIVESVGPPTEN